MESESLPECFSICFGMMTMTSFLKMTPTSARHLTLCAWVTGKNPSKYHWRSDKTMSVVGSKEFPKIYIDNVSSCVFCKKEGRDKFNAKNDRSSQTKE